MFYSKDVCNTKKCVCHRYLLTIHNTKKCVYLEDNKNWFEDARKEKRCWVISESNLSQIWVRSRLDRWLVLINSDTFVTLAVIWDYLDSALKKKWIHSSSSFAKASMLFVKKLNESLYLCVNYHDLNEITVKNNYSLSLLSETLNHFTHAKHFIKIDIYNIYHCIWICKSDEWKMIFHTCYDQFEYQMMLFELINAFAIFQFYVNHTLKSFINICCMIYLNDVLVYFEMKEQHWKHMCKILCTLLKY